MAHINMEKLFLKVSFREDAVARLQILHSYVNCVTWNYQVVSATSDTFNQLLNTLQEAFFPINSTVGVHFHVKVYEPSFVPSTSKVPRFLGPSGAS